MCSLTYYINIYILSRCSYWDMISKTDYVNDPWKPSFLGCININYLKANPSAALIYALTSLFFVLLYRWIYVYIHMSIHVYICKYMYHFVNKFFVDKMCYKSSIVLSFVNVMCCVVIVCLLLLLFVLLESTAVCVLWNACIIIVTLNLLLITVHAKTHDTSVNYINSCIFILGEDKNLPVMGMCALTENFLRDFLTDTLTVCIYMYIIFSLYVLYNLFVISKVI